MTPPRTDAPPAVVHRHIRRPGRSAAGDEHTSYWPESGLDIRSLAGDRTGLVVPDPRRRESLQDYLSRGGYATGGDPAALISGVQKSRLVGRGGAAFPLGVKLKGVRERPGPRYVVANGEEGEPLSVKDRWLLRIRPHLVLDGLLRAVHAVEADRAYVYVSDEDAAGSVANALAELDNVPVPVEVVRIEPSYVRGEETSVVRAINGGPALPVDKPPRPFEAGVNGAPTLVSNVETLANLPAIDLDGADAYVSRSLDPLCPGTFLLTLSGACGSPGLYEVPLGTRLRDVVEQVGGWVGRPRGALMGGYFAGLLGPDVLDLPLAYPVLRERGTGLGCGAIWLLSEHECPVAIAADLMDYFENNNARQCGPCIRGTSSMAAVLERLSRGTATAEDITKVTGWSTSLRGRGACAFLDGAANLAASLFREFGAEVETHRDGPCDVCKQRERVGSDRFALSIERSLSD